MVGLEVVGEFDGLMVLVGELDGLAVSLVGRLIVTGYRRGSLVDLENNY